MDWMPRKLRRLIGAIHETNHNVRAALQALQTVQALQAELVKPPAAAAGGANQIIELDYPVVPRKRPIERSAGGRALVAMIETARPRYEALLDDFDRLKGRFAAIDKESRDPGQPGWENGMLPALDAASLYAYVATRNPESYFEIGSGNSTKFVRRAISDLGLRTRIISVDPDPRAEIDGICDETIRVPFEDVADRLQQRIRSGDIVFLDGSHRSFQNSDVTVFFTEFLPALPRGTLYGIHDIFLPVDYPDDWLSRFYNEQFLLMAYLLGGAGGDEIAFPAYAVSFDPTNLSRLERLFDLGADKKLRPHGASFWLISAGRS